MILCSLKCVQRPQWTQTLSSPTSEISDSFCFGESQSYLVAARFERRTKRLVTRNMENVHARTQVEGHLETCSLESASAAAQQGVQNTNAETPSGSLAEAEANIGRRTARQATGRAERRHNRGSPEGRPAGLAVSVGGGPRGAAASAGWLTAKDSKMKDSGLPLRAAVTGTRQSPSIVDVIVALGREETIRRVEETCKKQGFET